MFFLEREICLYLAIFFHMVMVCNPGYSAQVTDAHGEVLFPKEKKWISLPRFSGKPTESIVLENNGLKEVHRGQPLKIRYRGNGTSDGLTGRRICLNVYSKVTRERGVLLMTIEFTINTRYRELTNNNKGRLVFEAEKYFENKLGAVIEEWKKQVGDYMIFDEKKNISSLLPIRIDILKSGHKGRSK